MTSEPRTAAGRKALERHHWLTPGEVLAIEAEAAAQPLASAALERLVAALELDNVWDIGPNGGKIAGALVQARAALTADYRGLLAEALMNTIGKHGWQRSDPPDPAAEWLANADAILAAMAERAGR